MGSKLTARAFPQSLMRVKSCPHLIRKKARILHMKFLKEEGSQRAGEGRRGDRAKADEQQQRRRPNTPDPKTTEEPEW